jgi:hypothetical protein
MKNLSDALYVCKSARAILTIQVRNLWGELNGLVKMALWNLLESGTNTATDQPFGIIPFDGYTSPTWSLSLVSEKDVSSIVRSGSRL